MGSVKASVNAALLSFEHENRRGITGNLAG
jgi:hypothetical protein